MKTLRVKGAPVALPLFGLKAAVIAAGEATWTFNILGTFSMTSNVILKPSTPTMVSIASLFASCSRRNRHQGV